MICPFCRNHISGRWQVFRATTDSQGKPLPEPVDHISIPCLLNPGDKEKVWGELTFALEWMLCPNEDCGELLVITRRAVTGYHATLEEDLWFAVPPKSSPRLIDPLVVDPYRRDYLESSAILEDSPRMSATLSRKILADLLRQYAQRAEFKLSNQIDEFIKDPAYPESLKANLHHLREMGDFSAHTQVDQNTGAILEVSREEAEWTLDVIDGLFDYFIVGPAKDKLRRAEFDKKITAAGRKPITRLKD